MDPAGAGQAAGCGGWQGPPTLGHSPPCPSQTRAWACWDSHSPDAFVEGKQLLVGQPLALEDGDHPVVDAAVERGALCPDPGTLPAPRDLLPPRLHGSLPAGLGEQTVQPEAGMDRPGGTPSTPQPQSQDPVFQPPLCTPTLPFPARAPEPSKPGSHSPMYPSCNPPAPLPLTQGIKVPEPSPSYCPRPERQARDLHQPCRALPTGPVGCLGPPSMPLVPALRSQVAVSFCALSVWNV